jgi:multidrug transporter EmrE-like cation transporter
MNGWAWLAVAIAATAVGQLLFKHASVTRSRPFTIYAIGAFCIAPVTAFMALHFLSIATVYVCTAISQVIVVLASMALFGERYDNAQWGGLGLILAGVVVFNLP